MPSYLEDLTLRLAQGALRLPEEVRARHAGFLRRAQNADGGFSGREGGSDLYYTGFGVRGLALLGELDGEPAQRAAAFLRARLAGQAPIVDFFSLLYAAALLQTGAGIDVFAAAAEGWRTAVDAALERFRRPDGGYAKTDEGQASSTYYTFLVVLSREIIGVPPTDVARLVEFVLSRRRDDGGFVEMGPMKRSGTNPTAAGVGTLKVVGALSAEVREATLDYLAGMQSDEGGLTANTRIPVADVLSTFTGTLTWLDLGGAGFGDLDLAAARRYVESMQLADGGFHGGAWDPGTDVEYTFYGLGGLALLHGAEATSG